MVHYRSDVAFLCNVVRAYYSFFKQKTAYDMRISDWSSDVCSSDLGVGLGEAVGEPALAGGEPGEVLGLQLLAPADLHRQRAQLVDRRDQRGRHARAGDLLDHDAGRQRIGPGTAVLLGDRKSTRLNSSH